MVVQTNPLIWESVSASARLVDKKMQTIEASVIKSATKLVKVVDKMAKMEEKIHDEMNAMMSWHFWVNQINKEKFFTTRA